MLQTGLGERMRMRGANLVIAVTVWPSSRRGFVYKRKKGEESRESYGLKITI